MTKRLYRTEYETENGWSEWIHPLPGYRFSCCDCGLVHEMELATEAKHGKKLLFRARRDNRATAGVRRGAAMRVSIAKLAKGKVKK